jgi:Predicted dehydrogenase
MKTKDYTNICIIGGGMVGLSLAHQIIQRYPKLSIAIIDKENKIGMHTSGRNSGILHAGIYYEPGSLKSKDLCFWCKETKKMVSRTTIPI